MAGECAETGVVPGMEPGPVPFERADNQSIAVRRCEGLRVVHRDSDMWRDQQLVKLVWEKTAVEPVGPSREVVRCGPHVPGAERRSEILGGTGNPPRAPVAAGASDAGGPTVVLLRPAAPASRLNRSA